MSDVGQGPGYWLASDGKWYPPELHPSRLQPQSQPPPPTQFGPVATTVSAQSWNDSLQVPHTTQSGGAGWSGPRTATLQRPVDAFGPHADAFAIGPTTPPPRRRGGRRALRWGSVVVAAVVVTVGALVAVSGHNTTWDPRVLGIVHFDQQHRGLTFKEPVKVEFLDKAQFNQEVSVPQPTSNAARAQESRFLGELRALGLVHGNVNLATEENKLTQADVVGLYVDSKKTVFVRGTALTPYVRVTLAHELTHALQDQYFNLDKLRQGIKGGDDTALTALIEGDAVRDENLYEQSLSVGDQQAYQDEQNQLEKSAGQSSSTPEILNDMLSFPYAFGPTFVDSLASNGGTAAIDHAFRDPPVAEAQIVDPVTYPIGWNPARVPTPALSRGQRRIDTPGPFGQVSLFEVLGSRLGYDQAWNAVQGWQGDNSLPYKDHGRTCMAIDVDMGTTGAAADLASAGREWARSIPGATVSEDGKMVRLRSCDPGPKALGAPTITPSAFDVLSTRAEIIDAIVTGDHVDFAMGKCVADKVLVGVGPSGYGELSSSNLTSNQQSQLQQLVASSAGSCQAQGVT